MAALAESAPGPDYGGVQWATRIYDSPACELVLGHLEVHSTPARRQLILRIFHLAHAYPIKTLLIENDGIQYATQFKDVKKMTTTPLVDPCLTDLIESAVSKVFAGAFLNDFCPDL